MSRFDNDKISLFMCCFEIGCTHFLFNSNRNFISSINEILNNGNKIALIYPIPEVGWNPIRRLLNNSYFNKQNSGSERSAFAATHKTEHCVTLL